MQQRRAERIPLGVARKSISFSFPAVATLEKILLNLDNLCLAVSPSALLCYARSFLRGGSNISRNQKFSYRLYDFAFSVL